MAYRIEGHEAWTQPHESGSGWQVECSCGWPRNSKRWAQGRTFQLEATAAAEVARHIVGCKRAQLRLQAASGLSRRQLEDGGTVVAGS